MLKQLLIKLFKNNTMCFITERSKIRLAIKNIECYKEVRTIKNYYFKNCCFSYYLDFKYEYDKIYSGKSKLKLFIRWLFNKYVSSEGYHSYTTSENTSIKCIIPKWSLYLINEEGTKYVSTSIKILKP